MNVKEILAKTDHTLLAQGATWEEIKAIIDDGIKYGTASVCIPPCFVKKAAEYARGGVKICTVIGFPNGYNSTEVKCFEAECAERDGADEIDMVANIGMIKEKRYADVLAEINAVSRSCRYSTLKVIVETCLLTEEEKVKMCDVVSASQAQYIKTSTGFAGGGAGRSGRGSPLSRPRRSTVHWSQGTVTGASGLFIMRTLQVPRSREVSSTVPLP